jgi:hypothetical protein
MKHALMLALLLPLFGYAQKLKVNEVDKFTKQKRLETSNATLKAKLAEGIGVSFRCVDSSLYVVLAGYGPGTGVVGEDDKAIFLLDDETTVTVYSTGLQSYTINKYQNVYNHQYRLTIADLQTLSKKNLKSIRKYTSKGYADIDIPEKNSDEVSKIAALILNNLE